MTNLPVIHPNLRTHDNTMTSAANKCMRLYHYRHHRHLVRKRGGEGVAAAWGTMLHAGLATWYKTWDPMAALETILHYPWEDDPDDYRTKARCLETMAEYIQWYGDESTYFEKKVLLNETPFDLEDPTDGFRWGGIIDLVVLYHGKPWIIDHKSTSVDSSGWWTQFELSGQMAGYVYAASLLHGEPVAGVIVNRALIHKVKKGPEIQFQRRPFLYPAWKIDEWKRMKIRELNAIHAEAEAARIGDVDLPFPPNWDACFPKFGRCTFYDVCSLPPGDRERALESDFGARPWDWQSGHEESLITTD